MKRQSILLLAGLVSVGALGPVLAQRERARERSATPEGRARDIAQDMRDARELLRKVIESAERNGNRKGNGNGARDRESRRDDDDYQRRLEVLLDRSERDARDLEREIRRLQDEVRLLQDGRNNGRFTNRAVISDRDFRDLTDAVRRRPSSSDKLSMIRVASQGSYFTTAQLRDLIGLVSFGSDQETVAVQLYPRLVDQNRFFTLSDAFRFSSSWRTVCERLRIPQ